MASSAATLTYDRDENIVWIAFPVPVELKTRPQIAEHFAHVIRFWRVQACGKKAYFVVDFDNLTIDAAELEFYAEQSKRAQDFCAIASVRYGGNPLQRTVTRLAGMKIHRPSNICETRHEALAMVQKLKEGEALAAGGSAGP
jgi:hypothetical protein